MGARIGRQPRTERRAILRPEPGPCSPQSVLEAASDQEHLEDGVRGRRPRSGTSLVQSVLAAHSELFSIPGETGLCSRQNIFGRRHFGLSWAENRSLFADSRDLVDFFDRAVGLLESRSPGATFVEKAPQHVVRSRLEGGSRGASPRSAGGRPATASPRAPSDPPP